MDPFQEPAEIVSLVLGTGKAANFAAEKVRARMRRRAQEVGALGIELSDVSADEVLARVESNDQLLELVTRVGVAAQRAATLEHRQALALVLANALRGDDAAIDVSMLIERTLRQIDRQHIRVLVELRGTKVTTALDLVALGALLPADADALRPVLAVLVGEGLASNASGITSDGREAWYIAPFGERLLDVLIAAI